MLLQVSIGKGDHYNYKVFYVCRSFKAPVVWKAMLYSVLVKVWEKHFSHHTHLVRRVGRGDEEPITIPVSPHMESKNFFSDDMKRLTAIRNCQDNFGKYELFVRKCKSVGTVN